MGIGQSFCLTLVCNSSGLGHRISPFSKEEFMSMSQKYSGFTKSIFCSLMILCLVFVINSSLAWGQAASTSTGTIVGQVTDPSGAVVPKATVTITNAATSTKRTTQTADELRGFAFPTGWKD